MKLSRASQTLLIVSLFLFASLLFVVDRGSQIRNEEFTNMRTRDLQKAERARVENPGKVHFNVYNGQEPDRNWAENLSVGFLILTFSSLVAAFWLRKR
jgi:hypothetical protein